MYSTSKNYHQKENSEYKMFTFFGTPKMGKLVFDLGNGK